MLSYIHTLLGVSISWTKHWEEEKKKEKQADNSSLMSQKYIQGEV